MQAVQSLQRVMICEEELQASKRTVHYAENGSYLMRLISQDALWQVLLFGVAAAHGRTMCRD